MEGDVLVGDELDEGLERGEVVYVVGIGMQ